MQIFKFFLLFLLSSTSFSYEVFRNYSSTISVSDFEIMGDSLLVASSGGLYIFNLQTGHGQLQASNSMSPDPTITSICIDNNKNIWCGSAQGYLIKRSPNGTVTPVYTYYSGKTGITDLFRYGDYIIVGTSKGLSFFNPAEMIVEKNATKFGNLPSSQVNTIAIDYDSLYVGVGRGFAKLRAKNWIKSNFYDPSIWKTDSTIPSSILSFVPVNGKLKPYLGLTAIYQGKLLESKGNELLKNGQTMLTFQSDIIALKIINNICWIGTKESFFCSWDGTNLKRFSIPGPTTTFFNKIFVDHSGKLWSLPRVASDKWWVGINSFDGNRWNLYSNDNIPVMGLFQDNPDHRAIVESRHPGANKDEWRMWFGTSGGNIKFHTPASDDWSIYCVGNHKKTNSGFFHGSDACRWWKVDAIAQDSSLFMWISSWKDSSGSLICYDARYEPVPSQIGNPSKAHYRYFFQKDVSDYFSNSYKCLTVDLNGNILAGSEDGELLVFNHRGNPIDLGVNVIGFFNGLGDINDIQSMPDGTSLIAASKGLFKYDPAKYPEQYTPASKKEFKLDTLDEYGTNISLIELEGESVLWFAVAGVGLVRYTADGERTVISTTHGLISNDISDLALDKKNGFLWIATDVGISRLAIGYTLAESKKNTSVAYPNPFSSSRHKSIFFRNLPTDSKVSIYSIDGRLAGLASVVRTSDRGTFLEWSPSPDILPGTYFYTASQTGSVKASKSGKLLIVP
jgi:ligand-binding sensor domain-containing protein